jgi:hypothetical protein
LGPDLAVVESVLAGGGVVVTVVEAGFVGGAAGDNDDAPWAPKTGRDSAPIKPARTQPVRASVWRLIGVKDILN